MMQHFEIDQVVPHEQPMSLLGKVEDYDDTSATCSLDIHPNQPFFDIQQNGVPSYVGIEYMAQTIAAYSGIQSRLVGESPQLGFLLGSRKYNPKVHIFNDGEKLLVKAEKIVQEDSGLCVFDCTISIDGEVVANSKVNAFQPNDVEAFLRSEYE